MDAGHVGVDERVAARLRPPGHRLRPGPHAREVAQLVAQVDDRAVEVTGPQRVDLTGEHREHRLVEVGETLLRATATDGRHAAGGQGEAGQGGIVVLPPEGGDLRRGGVGGVGGRRAAREVHAGDVVGVEEVAVQRPAGQPGDDAAGAREPRHADRDVAAGQPLESQPERPVRRLAGLALREQAPVDLLGDLHRLRRVTEPPGCLGQQAEVAGRQRLAGAGEARVDRAPVAPPPRRSRR